VNAVDLAVLAVIALSAVFAFARGFVREALSIVAWVGAALITLYGFDSAYRMTARFVTTPLLAELIAGAGLFLVSLIGLTILTGYIARFAQWSALSPIDRTLGLIFGVARGAVLVSIAYLVIDISLPPPDRPSWLREAKSEPFLAQGADMLRGMLPEALQAKSASAVDDAQHALSQAKAAQDAMGALSSPAAPPLPPKAAEPSAPAYKPAEQRDLDRLIDNNSR
jgi:membrane protein required for colicin V production